MACNSCDPCKNTRGQVCDTPEKLQVTVNVPDYKPNQLCVKVNDDCLEVRGNKEECGKKECFTEKYPLPCDVDKCTIKWEYCDCKLIINACKKKSCC